MNLEELERLSEFKEKGIITEEEFLQQKKKLLESSNSDEVDISNNNDVKGKDNIVINNNVTVDTGKRGKKIGLLTVMGYIVGIPLLLSSIIYIFSGNIIGGIFLLLSSLSIIPIFNDFLENKFNFKLSRILRIILFFVFVSIAMPIINNGEKSNSLATDSNSELSTVKNETNVKEIKLNDKITPGDFEITLLDAYVKDTWEIPNNNPYLAYSFKADDGKTYIVSKISIKNLSTESENFGNYSLITESCKAEAICNVDYKYSMFFRGENDTFSTGYITIEPLETEIAYLYKEVPDEAVNSSIKIKYEIFGTDYIYNLK